ncbi:Inactive tyrosine-protein kinase 7 [Acipenser ruthenus]|uniref:Inactive tyrosine-protein kinase 7 n=1 Tax=Acipenser ruthenus TaxID=7906 RepID=A0A444UJA7_ACIRT|nr:Inactive tyrosine-protein kinase 7 [Acipenser ruthenus]
MAFDWLHDGVPVQDSERRFKESSNLKFTAVDRHEDAGNFQCVATNTVSKEEARSTNASFNIKWLETGVVTLKEPPTVSEIQSSSPVTLRCNIDGHPRPTCQWFKDGSKLTDKIHQINNKERTLTLKSASPDDNGVYYCCAKNAVGQICSSDNFTLSIIDESYPQPLIIPRDQVVNRNEEAMFHCQFTAQPPPVQEWFFEGELIANKTRVVLFNNGSLQITQVKTRNTGVYKCVAKGPKGNSAEVTATLRIADHPGEDSQHWGLQVCGEGTKRQFCRGDRNTENSRFQKMPNGSLVISDVTTEDSGKYTCIAGNSCNIKHRDAFLYVVEKPVTKSQEENGQTPYKMIQTIGLSVGAAVAYIIVVLGLMFYCKKRRNAKRLQKGPEEEEPEMECLNVTFNSFKTDVTKGLPASPAGRSSTVCLQYAAVAPGGSTVQQNGQTTAEIQEEVALTNMGTTVTASKRHSSNDKIHFLRTNLQTITTLASFQYLNPHRNPSEIPDTADYMQAKGVEDPETETVVLVKSLQTRDEQLQMDFRREFEMFGKLNHSNVVQLLGLCREAEPHYMILEYVDLGDLKQFLKIAKSKDEKIKPQPISTKQKVSICGQVAMGMEHLSNHRFVHKDLAARNCLISAQRQVKVSICGQVAMGMEHLSNHRFVHKDLAARNCLISAQRQVKVSALGLSKDVYNSEYYHFRQAWIPLRWLPAESIFEDDFSTKSDVWSFGVLMWEVFTHGEQPYIKLTDDEVLAGLQGGKMKLPAPEGCPSKLYKLMVRCWAPSPKDRPSFSELANALGEIPADSKA